MIVIIDKKKQKLVRKAIANTIIMCTTNQNGKKAFNDQAAGVIGLTFDDLEILNKLLPRKKNIKKTVK